MGYTVDQIHKRLNYIDQVYKNECLNYRGKAETGQYYQEVCAEHFVHMDFPLQLQNANLTISRKTKYSAINHDGKIRGVTRRAEEHLAKIIFNTFKNRALKPLGEMLDYQVPLKNNRNDQAGKIDLISYDGQTLYLIELKDGKSSETLLRAMMEVATYEQWLDTKKLFLDYGLADNTKVEKAVLFPRENGYLTVDCDQIDKGILVHLGKLLNLLQVGVCILDWGGTDFLRELKNSAELPGPILFNAVPGLYTFAKASISLRIP